MKEDYAFTAFLNALILVFIVLLIAVFVFKKQTTKQEHFITNDTFDHFYNIEITNEND